ncbi:pectin lyase fold/virulence factor [Elsinoe ampelina]|uniref:Pectin lyase fold/virulence factor n=1 Tax=Elsinoe ampelina TaxID=302913 RepID=A0A6A6GMT4_9PEZI|nr:pectin lyase fold/virulence factor [Elsinoe ampelina]
MRSATLPFVSALVPLALAADIFVSPSGTGTGSITAPFGSIQSAVNAAKAGDVINLRAGTYKPTKNIQITKSGTSSAPITLRSYGTEKVIIDGESLTGTPAALDASLANADRGILHIEKADYWKFYNLELINGPYGVYARDANNNYYERLSTHDNYESGFQIQGASSYNTVIYLDSYRNRDPRKNGESADGFACKEGKGEGNSIRNSRLYENVDDGLDLWMFESAVTIEEVYAWGNGVNRWGFSNFQGDGNGFKLGGASSNPPAAPHVVRNSIAFENLKKGFIDNGNPGAILAERNTAYKNGDTGFATTVSTVKASGNSWQSGSWSDSSFASTSSTQLKAARLSNGRVQGSNFLLPTSGAAIGATTQADV